MKITKVIFFLFVFGLSSSATHAQKQKFAHINRSKLMQQMPEVKTAREDLEKYSNQLQNQIQTLLEEYRAKLKEYQNISPNVSETIRQDKEQELKQLEERIQKFQQSAQQEVTKKEQELLKPIFEKINNAIEEVAKEKGYTYVFDVSTGAIMYADESQNIMPEVKQKLGL